MPQLESAQGMKGGTMDRAAVAVGKRIPKLDAVEKAMELTNPTTVEICEETFELVKELGYEH